MKDDPERSPYVFSWFSQQEGVVLKSFYTVYKGNIFQKSAKTKFVPPNRLNSVQNRFPRSPPDGQIARISNFAIQNLKHRLFLLFVWVDQVAHDARKGSFHTLRPQQHTIAKRFESLPRSSIDSRSTERQSLRNE